MQLSGSFPRISDQAVQWRRFGCAVTTVRERRGVRSQGHRGSTCASKEAPVPGAVGAAIRRARAHDVAVRRRREEQRETGQTFRATTRGDAGVRCFSTVRFRPPDGSCNGRLLGHAR